MANLSDVFISYSRRNTEFARKLFDKLEQTRREVWADWEDIPYSVDWMNEIKAGIDAAESFVIIVTPDSMTSRVCHEEIEHARLNNKRIIPVIHMDIDEKAVATEWFNQPWEDTARTNWNVIKRLNWLFFREQDDFEEAFKQLIKTIEEDPDYVRMHTWLLVRARDWEQRHRNTSHLLSGDEILDAEHWLANADGHTPEATELHREYITESRRVEDNRQRLLRRLRAATVVLAVVGLLALGATAFSLLQARDAQAQRNEAVQTLDVANAELAVIDVTLEGAQTAQADALQNAENAQAEATNAGFAVQTAEGEIAAANIAVTSAAQAQQTANAQAATAESVAAEAENAAATAENQAAQAQANVLVFEATLTPAAEAIAQADEQLAAAETQIADAEIQVTQVNEQVIQAQTAEAEAQQQANEAATNVVEAETAEAAAQVQVTQVNEQVIQAQEEARIAGETLTPVPQTLDAAALQITQAADNLATANVQVTAANEQVVEAQDAEAQAREQVATAQIEVTNANVERATLAVQIEVFGATLTPVSTIVDGAFVEVTNAANRVAEANLAVTDAAATLDPIETEVARAQAEAEEALAEAERARNLALSQSLANNAELAINNGNHDQAVALLLEASALNPDLTQTFRLLNQTVYDIARLNFETAADFALNPVSNLVAVTQGNTIVIANIETREEILRLEGHSAAVNTIAFSEDGIRLASGADDNTVIEWDINNAANPLVQRFEGHNGPVNDVQFSPDGTRILSGSADETAIIWDTRTGSAEATYVQQNRPIFRVEFNSNGLRFFTWARAGADGTVAMSLWDVGRNQPRTTRTDYQLVNFGGVDDRLATDDQDNQLVIYDAFVDLSIQRNYTQGFNFAQDVIGESAFRPGTSHILVEVNNREGTNNRLLLLDYASQAQIASFSGQGTQRVDALAFSPDGNRALSGFGEFLVLWDVETGQEVRRLAAHSDRVDSIEFSPDGRYAVSRSLDGNVRVWDVAAVDPTLERVINSPTTLTDMEFVGLAPGGSAVYANIGAVVFAWETTNYERVNSITDALGILNVVYSPAQPYALVIRPSTAAIYDMAQQASGVVQFIGSGGETFTGVADFSQDGEQVAIVNDNRTVVLRDVRTNGRLTEMSRENIPFGQFVTDVAISPDKRFVYGAVALSDEPDSPAGPIIIWDAEEGNVLAQLDTSVHTRTINDIALSPDGTRLLSASDDDTIVLWDIVEQRLLRRLVGHRGPVNDVQFIGDTNTALSSSDDGTLIYWDLESAQPIREFVGHNAPITSFDVSAERGLAVSTTGLEEEPIILWRIETLPEIVEWTYANRFVYTLTCEERLQFDLTPCEGNTPPAQATAAFTPAAAPTEVELTGATEAPATGEATPEPTATLPVITVTVRSAQGVNVRSGDDTSFARIAVLQAGETATALGVSTRGNGWLNIELADGQRGWVLGSTVVVDGDVNDLPGVTPPVIQTGGGGQPQATAMPGGGGQAPAPTEAPAVEDVCAPLRITSPGALADGMTTFFWDKLNIPARYWVTIFNAETGEQVLIFDTGGDSNSLALDTSVANIGPGAQFRVQVTAFYQDQSCSTTAVLPR